MWGACSTEASEEKKEVRAETELKPQGSYRPQVAGGGSAGPWAHSASAGGSVPPPGEGWGWGLRLGHGPGTEAGALG